MEKLVNLLIQHQKKCNKLAKKQNLLLQQLVEQSKKKDKEYLLNNLLDNTDVKQIFKVGDTKLYSIKKKLPTYRPDGKDYYFADEVVDEIKKHRTPPPQAPD